MKNVNCIKKLSAMVTFLFLFCVASSAQEAARPSGDAQLLPEILIELKQLRSTMVRTNVNQIRFQTTFDQYKSQQFRVDAMNRELDSLKNQLTINNPSRANQEEMIKMTEERLQQTTDPRARQSLERQLQMTRRNIETQDQRDKRTKERQSNLEFQIPVEQAKLDQLNAELERIKQDINALVNQ